MEWTEDKEWGCGNGKIVILQMVLILKKGKESINKIYKLELNARGGEGCGRIRHGFIILSL